MIFGKTTLPEYITNITGRTGHEILGLSENPPGPLPAMQGGTTDAAPYIAERMALCTLYRNATEIGKLKAQQAQHPDNAQLELILEQAQRHPHLGSEEDLQAFFELVGKEVPEKEQENFHQQCVYALEAARSNAIPKEAGRLALATPPEQLIWTAVLAHGYANQTITAEKFQGQPVPKALIQSVFMDNIYNMLSQHVPSATKIVHGAPGDWFRSFQGDKKRGIPPKICLELGMSLILGGGFIPEMGMHAGHFLTWAHHEIGHDKYSKIYPPTMQENVKRLADLAAKGGMELPTGMIDGKEEYAPPAYPPDSKLTKAEYKEFELLSLKHKLMHGIWNSAEDSCVNRYAVNLSDSHHDQNAAELIKLNMADSLNIAETIANVGNHILTHHNSAGAPAETTATPENTTSKAEQRYNNLDHAINMAFYISNRLEPDSPEGLASLGVELSLLPGDTPEDQWNTWQRIRELSLEIQQRMPNAQASMVLRHSFTDPLTGEEHQRVTFDEMALVYNRWRNVPHEEILAMAMPCIEQMLREAEPRIDQKIQNMEQKGAGQPEPGEGGLRVEGIEGNAPAPISGGTPRAQEGIEHGVRTGGQGDRGEDQETAGQRRGRQTNGAAPPGMEEGQENAPQPAPAQGDNKPVRPAVNMNQGAVASSGGNPLDIVLSDGRSYKELQTDPFYLAAVEAATERLADMARRIQTTEHRLVHNQYEMPGGGDDDRRLDVSRVEDLAQRISTGEIEEEDFCIVRREAEQPLPVTHDLVILMDGSGSMGANKGSRMETCMKTVALLNDACRKLGEESHLWTDADHVPAPFQVYAALWGGAGEWKDDATGLPRNLILSPDMEEEIKAQRIEAVLNGLGSGTELAPAFPCLLQYIADQKSPAYTDTEHGATHFIIPSDGDVFDRPQALANMRNVLEQIPNATMDILITDNLRQTELEELAGELQLEFDGRVACHHISLNETPAQLVQILDDRASQPIPGHAMTHAQYIGKVRAAADQSPPLP